MQETKGRVTLGGKPITLLGTPVKVGQKAPNFKLLSKDMKDVELSQSKVKSGC